MAQEPARIAMRGNAWLALLLVAAASASHPKVTETHSSLEGEVSGLAEAKAALRATPEALKRKRDDSDRRFVSLKHLAQNLGSVKDITATDDSDMSETSQTQGSIPSTASSAGHHASADRLEVSSRQWQLNRASKSSRHIAVTGEKVVPISKVERPRQHQKDSRKMESASASEEPLLGGAKDASKLASSLKTKLQDTLGSMHAALHETEAEQRSKEHAQALDKEREELKRKRLAAEERLKAAGQRKKDALTEALRAKAMIANKKLAGQKAKSDYERQQREADSAAHEKMVAYRALQAEEEAKEKSKEEEAAKKAEEEAEKAKEAEEAKRALREDAAEEAIKAARAEKAAKQVAMDSDGRDEARRSAATPLGLAAASFFPMLVSLFL